VAVPLLGDVIAVLESWFDPGWAESWDAVGLVCGDPTEPVERILLAVDAVPGTVTEALERRAQLLVTHHPLLLTPVHGVPATDPKGRLVHRMIRHSVAHYVAHTNADVASPGVSDALADRLGLLDLEPLEPQVSPEAGGRGLGRIGRLPRPMPLTDFLAYAASVLPANAWGLRAAGDPDQLVQTVAVCGGSGASLAEQARAAGADAYLTADLKHHATLEAVLERGPGMALIDAGHWASEAPWLDVLAARLRERFGTTVEITVSDQVTDPWNLHVPSNESSTQSL
jgi:dinuclear metal center YbgI/SA1388 family protein